MLNTFPSGSLPGFTLRPLTSSDAAMFENAWDAALRIDFACVQNRPRQMGWTYMGEWSRQFYGLSASVIARQ